MTATPPQPPVSDDLVSRLRAIPYSGAVADILCERGHRNQVLHHQIQAVHPGGIVAGRARTAVGAPTTSMDPEVIFAPYLDMLGSLTTNDVIVIQANDSSVAHIGELSSETAQSRGAAGAVIDGGARDIAYIERIGFPVFARYTTPADINGRWRLVERDAPVVVGGVTVCSGDLVLGDADGVVVIPAAMAAEVVAEAEEVVNTENIVRQEILAGAHPLDAFRRHGRF